VKLENTCTNGKLVLYASSKELKVEASHKPEKFNSIDKFLEVKDEAVYKPETNVFENTSSIRFGSPKLGPLRVWFNGQYFFNNKEKKNIIDSVNFQINDDFNFGIKSEHNTHKFTKLDVQGMWKQLSG